MRITRRHCLATSAAGILASAATASAAFAGLRQMAAQRGLRFGATSDVSDLPFETVPAEYKALFVQNCALYAPNISHHRISPTQGVYDFRYIDPQIGFYAAQGLQMSGGHFLFHRTVPAWFKALPSRAAAEQAAADYILAVGKRYRGRVYAWNVTNEAIKPEAGRLDGLRPESAFVALIGPDYFDAAFKTARIADPHALLAYNDFDMELDTPEHAKRQAVLLRLIDGLLHRGVPIDAIGLQSHLKATNFHRFNATKYRAFLHELSRRGLPIFITELDVLDVGAPTDVSERDKIVASIYSQFLEAALDETNVKALVLWGLSDRYTYQTPAFSPSLARADGLPTRPSPFDEGFNPKPAFHAIQNAINAAPNRALR